MLFGGSETITIYTTSQHWGDFLKAESSEFTISVLVICALSKRSRLGFTANRKYYSKLFYLRSIHSFTWTEVQISVSFKMIFDRFECIELLLLWSYLPAAGVFANTYLKHPFLCDTRSSQGTSAYQYLHRQEDEHVCLKTRKKDGRTEYIHSCFLEKKRRSDS